MERGTRALRPIALVAVMLGVGALAPAAPADTFRIDFQVTQGKFDSSWSCLPGCKGDGGYHTLSETDGGSGPNALRGQASYEDLKIPSKGPAAWPGHPIILSAYAFGVGADFHLFGTYWTSDNPNAPVDCTGRLRATKDEPELVSASGNTKTDLKLDVELARTNSDGATLVPEGATGTGNCSELNGHDHAGFPVSWPDNGRLVQDMLTAAVTVPLNQLRALKKKGKYTMHFDEQKAKYQPPPNCKALAGYGQCTESLHWSGELTFERTR